MNVREPATFHARVFIVKRDSQLFPKLSFAQDPIQPGHSFEVMTINPSVHVPGRTPIRRTL